MVHTCCILYNILFDIKKIDFNPIFNEMDAYRALLQSDQARGHHEPVVDRNTIEGSELREKLIEYTIFK